MIQLYRLFSDSNMDPVANITKVLLWLEQLIITGLTLL